ncbi:Holliday junction branch migration protein RuvA [Candidatus Wolfebacteria bacterium]|nr:Holliday junction branch migration protein RuvA [Candidatus Wolfebacteria bacterium]
MIASLFGKLIAKSTDRVIVDIGGIGFAVFISKSTANQLPKLDDDLRLYTIPHLTRDSLELYGFLDQKELDVFRALTSVNGVGPKAAIKILGGATVAELETGIRSGRTDILTKVSGVGGKKAERIVLELRDLWSKEDVKEATLALEYHDELHGILRKLGYKDQEIRGAVRALPKETMKLEDQLRAALKNLSH